MRRGSKPEVDYYTPGRGPLRKSEARNEETDSDSKSYARTAATNRLLRIRQEESAKSAIPQTEMSSARIQEKNEDRKKQKKPEQMFFNVRQHVVQKMNRQIDSKNERNINGNYQDQFNRSKRYSHRRGPNERNNQEEWRGSSPNRNFRQGSEPRSSNRQPASHWNRDTRFRDTRSVEPQNMNTENRNYNSEKSYQKPPSGRRHSTCMEPEKRQRRFQLEIPPRFQKSANENHINHNVPVEEPWDGSSMIIKGSTQQNYVPKHNYSTNPHLPQHNLFHTLPNRTRGRGRFVTDSDNSTGLRSMTPDYLSPGNSRSATPTFTDRTRSTESLNRMDSRSQTPVQMYRNDRQPRYNRNEERQVRSPQKPPEKTPPSKGFRESLEAQLSPVSPPTSEEKPKHEFVPNKNNVILDWSEEVEMQASIEAEALSDALTRSSSMASLMETSTKSLPANSRPSKSKKKKNRKYKRSGSNQRERSVENREYSGNEDYGRNRNSRQRQNSHTSIDSNFKVPEERRFRRHSREFRNRSRETSFERNRKNSFSEHEGNVKHEGSVNWREENSRNLTDITIKRNIERDELEVKKAGIIHLPQTSHPPVLNMKERVDTQRKTVGQKSLFDHNNPNKPIIINKPNSRVAPAYPENQENPPQQHYTTDKFGNIRPNWHIEDSESWKLCHYSSMLYDIKEADDNLQTSINTGNFLLDWPNACHFRNFLMQCLEFLLCHDLKFSQTENVEQYFWRVLYHNIIEVMRKYIASDPPNRDQYKAFVLKLIDEGTRYYEGLLETLEKTYDFKLVNYIGCNQHAKAGGYKNMALISAQKIYICLGDLGRYREQINETSNYGKCRHLYIKAREINPKNGRPYNQLAVLAVYSRKKLDAVYYYMRSLMSTNPVPSARESLISLFDENRKKYEHSERKRREERLEKARQHMKEKESEDQHSKPSSLRKETWIRPDGGRRVHLTTSTLQDSKSVDSEEEDLATLSSVEVNKRFVTSYLHVHGKLITKIGMESFHETALQMLKEFRALLQHSPLPLPSTRFLQLLALNMFSIESTQLKDPQLQSGYRSELQERALVVSLQMFSLILEKCISVLRDHINSSTSEDLNAIPQDAQELLPSVKIWCDWMICHSGIWNPPPSTQDFKVGPAGDAWSRIATLMNLLEKLDRTMADSFKHKAEEGYEQVRLPEDGALSGFTPLMYNDQEPTYVPKEFDMETAQFVERLEKLLFFGTTFICGLEPPVLKLVVKEDFREYVSVVCTTAQRSSPNTPPELNENELLLETFSDEEEDLGECSKGLENAPTEIQELLSRKVELEKRHRDQELHRQTVQKILQQSVVSVHIEVKPKNLVPDTNCFIDYLAMLKKIATCNVYTLMVPLVVLNELEGLSKGLKSPMASPRSVIDPLHVVKVAESAKLALEFLSTKHPHVKCITTKGTILTSTAFTKEDDSLVDPSITNDDRILATCMILCKESTEQIIGEPRRLFREVVLLTEDRNLRVKALAKDVPVREVPSFLVWAGLG